MDCTKKTMLNIIYKCTKPFSSWFLVWQYETKKEIVKILHYILLHCIEKRKMTNNNSSDDGNGNHLKMEMCKSQTKFRWLLHCLRTVILLWKFRHSVKPVYGNPRFEIEVRMRAHFDKKLLQTKVFENIPSSKMIMNYMSNGTIKSIKCSLTFIKTHFRVQSPWIPW